MKTSMPRIYLAGFVAATLFVGSITVFDAILRHLFPILFNGMALLAFGPLELIVIMTVGLAISISSGFLIFRRMPFRRRIFIVLVGDLTIVVWGLALWFAYPALNRSLLVAVLAFMGGLIYVLEAEILSVNRISRVIISILLIIFGIYSIFAQYSGGTRRTQLKGLNNAGYTIYIPADSVKYKVRSITPTDSSYDGYKNGVTINLANGNTVTEKKVDHSPTPTCGSPYITVENAFNIDGDSAEDFSCQLVASNRDVDIYLLERKLYTSYYDDHYVSRVYFAVAGSTLIYTGDDLTIHYPINPKDQNTPEQNGAFDDSRDMLLDMIPVSNFSPYTIMR